MNPLTIVDLVQEPSQAPRRVAEVLVLREIDPFRVKSIPTTDPLGREAIAFHQCFPGRSFARYRDDGFGGETVEGLHVHPALIPAPTD